MGSTRAHLAQQCLALCTAVSQQATPSAQDASVEPQQPTDVQQAVVTAGCLRLQIVLGMTAEQAHQHKDVHASCLSQDPGLRREALLTLAQLVIQDPAAAFKHGADVLWSILQQTLSWPRGMDDPALLSAALQLAAALAGLTYMGMASPATCLPSAAQHAASSSDTVTAKRRRLVHQDNAEQQRQQQQEQQREHMQGTVFSHAPASMTGGQEQSEQVAQDQERTMPWEQADRPPPSASRQQAQQTSSPHMQLPAVAPPLISPAAAAAAPGMQPPAQPTLQPSQHPQQHATQLTHAPAVQLTHAPAVQLTHAPAVQLTHASAVQLTHKHAVQLTREHAVSLHRCLVGWCTHWHPRVKRAALQGLLAAHTGQTSTCGAVPGRVCTQENDLQRAQASTLPTPPAYLCALTALVEHAYSAAVTALADDHTGVRSCAAQLVAALACAQPALHLPGPRWQQLGHSQALRDDAFQRLCACVGDEEPSVRTLALQLLSGLPCCSLRVKLQALSKKATISVVAPSTASPAATLPGKGQSRAAHGQAQQSRGRGKAGSTAASRGRGAKAVEARGGSAYAWRGPADGKGLPLLDASVGALVHGTEDEDWMVRQATAAALLTVSLEEVKHLCTLGQAELSDTGSSSNKSSSSEVQGSRRQVVAQCIEYLCDLLQDEWDDVRLSAVQVLTQLLSMANQTVHELADKASLQSTAVATPSTAAVATPSAAVATPSAAVATPSSRPPVINSGAALQSAVQPVALDRDQVFAVLGCLNDSSLRVRQQVRRLLCVIPHWSLAQLKALVTVLVQAATAHPGQEAQQLVEAAKVVAAKVPGTAKTVATAIAKKQQQQQQQHGADLSTEATGDTAWIGQVSRQHLLVMKALVLGAGGLV